MYYAIRTALGEDIFDSWDACVKFRDLAPSNARFKKFATLEAAKAYLASPQSIVPSTPKRKCVRQHAADPCDVEEPTKKPVPNYGWKCSYVVAYTDGSFNADTGYWGYGAVLQDKNGRELATYSGNGTAYASSRNVTGEIYGAVRAIEAAVQQGCESILVKHDYEGVGFWADGKWKTNLTLTVWYKARIAELRKKIKITFERVPGHQGTTGNERADELAKSACFGIDL